MDRQVSCSICGQLIDLEDLEEHIRHYHLMDYDVYYEISTQSPLISNCWKCGALKIPITPYSNKYFLPCRKCLDKRKQKDFEKSSLDILESYIESIKDSKYIQYFLSDPNLKYLVFPHTIEEFCSICEELKPKKTRINNNAYFEISRKFCYGPPEISMRNLDSIQLDIYQNIFGKQIILNGNIYKIILPEECEYDSKHHSKYSILNLSSKKETRKLKFSDGQNTCIKFSGLSIFKLLDDQNNQVDPNTLSDSDKIILKEYILRDKTMFNILSKVYLEICKFTNIIHDSVFINNTIPISFDKNIEVFNFNWFDFSSDWSTNMTLNLKVI